MPESRQINEEAAERERIEIMRLQHEYNQSVNPQGAELRQQPPPLSVDKYGVTTALEVGPAVAGEAMGIPGGPTGMRLTGGIGAGVGRGLANSARDVERFIRSDKPPEGSFGERFLKGIVNQYGSMEEAAIEDIAFGTAFHAAGALRTPAKDTLRFLGGLKKPSSVGVFGQTKKTGFMGLVGENAPVSMEVTEAIEDASRANVNLGAKDLDIPFVRGAAKIFGIMPIVGGPIRKADRLARSQVSRALKTTLDGVSPAINLPALGVKLDKAARGAHNARRGIAGAKYERMKDNFAALRNPETGVDPDVIPTKPIVAQINEALGFLDDLPKEVITKEKPRRAGFGRITTGVETVTEAGPSIGIPPGEESFIEALQRFQNLPEYISYPQMEALQKNLNRAAKSRSGKEMGANEFRIITDINASTWDAMQSIPKEAGVGDDIINSIRSAKSSWADMKALEETAAARLFKRVDKNYWKAGFLNPSTANADEIADLYISNASTMRSPEFVRDMDSLIGPENRRAVGRGVLERAATPTESATGKMAAFDPFQMEQKLGLSFPEEALGEGSLKRNKQALAELLKGGDTTVGDVIAVINTAKRTALAPVGDPSTFLTRRIILGGGLLGAAALVGGGGAEGGYGGAAAGTGISFFTLGALVLGGRHVSSLLSTKEGLKILREGLKPNLTRQQTVLLADRIRRALPDEPIEIEGQ